MTFFDLISSRHSIRSFKSEIIPNGIIEKIVKAATMASSAGNLQSYKIFVVDNKEYKKKLAKAAHDQTFIEGASAVLVFCADPKNASKEYGERGEKLFCIQDATIACSYSQLAAHELGLASVLVGAFDESKVKKSINIDENLKPISMLVLGYANEKPEITPRKPFKEICQKI